ncbi:MAG: hypothetical protein ABS84_14100 [Rubrivivax sp. SCN 71-131]|nr:MAG: hypothetical protein ABS84_14100 [Rubrivivax sp. SCN 71-131]
MPVFAALFKATMAGFYSLYLAIKAKEIALRLLAIATIAATYIAAVTMFTAYVQPLIAVLFATSYGQVIGLAFPPIAGTVLAGLVALWGALVAKNYYYKVIKIGVS